MKTNFNPLYTTDGLITLKGKAADGVAIQAGQVLTLDTDGNLVKYTGDVIDEESGELVKDVIARGIALCDVSETDEDRDVIYAIAGAVIESNCVGLDANAKKEMTTIYFVQDSQL